MTVHIWYEQVILQLLVLCAFTGIVVRVFKFHGKAWPFEVEAAVMRRFC